MSPPGNWERWASLELRLLYCMAYAIYAIPICTESGAVFSDVLFSSVFCNCPYSMYCSRAEAHVASMGGLKRAP